MTWRSGAADSRYEPHAIARYRDGRFAQTLSLSRYGLSQVTVVHYSVSWLQLNVDPQQCNAGAERPVFYFLHRNNKHAARQKITLPFDPRGRPENVGSEAVC